ncbi:MAG: cytochrome c [Thermodesulfobacteriota bacterium]|nr:cytochrome c [Thermodesulfobacteriota bacterium]
MRRVISLFVSFLFLFLFICPSDSRSQDGEAVFKSACGRCHGSGGEGPAFSPVKFASSQWERFFDREKHNRWKDLSGVISGADMDAVKQYLMSHAADSDLPVASGLK